MSSYDLEDAVMMLHNIARTIERELGFGNLSNNIRKNADCLSDMLSPIKLDSKDEAHND